MKQKEKEEGQKEREERNKRNKRASKAQLEVEGTAAKEATKERIKKRKRKREKQAILFFSELTYRGQKSARRRCLQMHIPIGDVTQSYAIAYRK